MAAYLEVCVCKLRAEIAGDTLLIFSLVRIVGIPIRTECTFFTVYSQLAPRPSRRIPNSPK
eukprot:COSAG02_NODE_5173_length_4572_cov_2.069528_2_plen_61_part_00